jgi:putative uncharacterized protein MCJ_000960
MQLSQAIEFAIQRFDRPDYLIVMDYYDDISVFDAERKPQYVSYYQMKTSKERKTISSVRGEGWLTKLYSHICGGTLTGICAIEELGLITNFEIKTRLELTPVYQDDFVIKIQFVQYDDENIEKIKKDIIETLDISPSNVDLSKLVHIKTCLTIEEHRDQAERHMNDFLHKKYPNISSYVVQMINLSLRNFMSTRQGYEGLSETAEFSKVRAHKGVSKSDFERIIDASFLVYIPEYDVIEKWFGRGNVDLESLNYQYYEVVTDMKRKDDLQISLFKKIRELCQKYPIEENESKMVYIDRIRGYLDDTRYDTFDNLYIAVVLGIVKINERLSHNG